MNWIILCGIVILIIVIIVTIVIINEIRRRCQMVLIMRDLWSNHVSWIREYMIRQYEEPESLEKIVDRLTKNREDLGHVFGYFYGRPVGQQITQLLKEHVDGILEIIHSVTHGTSFPEFINEQPLSPRLSHTIQKWYHNADQIADAFEKLRGSSISPLVSPSISPLVSPSVISKILDLIRKRRDGPTFHQMMRQHLQLTLEEFKAHFRRELCSIGAAEAAPRGMLWTFGPGGNAWRSLSRRVCGANPRDVSDLEVFEKLRRGVHQMADQLTERLPWW